MNDRKQITIRAVKTLTYQRLQEVSATCKIPLGVLMDEAVERWWLDLPEMEEEAS